MRDAFGGAFMIRVFLIFILIYILLTALAMNYAKAYKVKELVISYLEDNEIFDITHMSSEEYTAMENYIDNVIGDLNYAREVDFKCPEGKECLRGFENRGITIVKEEPGSQSNKNGSYYVVTTYFGYDIWFLKLLQSASSDADTSSDASTIGLWKITGEKRLIYNENVK